MAPLPPTILSRVWTPAKGRPRTSFTTLQCQCSSKKPSREPWSVLTCVPCSYQSTLFCHLTVGHTVTPYLSRALLPSHHLMGCTPTVCSFKRFLLTIITRYYLYYIIFWIVGKGPKLSHPRPRSWLSELQCVSVLMTLLFNFSGIWLTSLFKHQFTILFFFHIFILHVVLFSMMIQSLWEMLGSTTVYPEMYPCFVKAFKSYHPSRRHNSTNS